MFLCVNYHFIVVFGRLLVLRCCRPYCVFAVKICYCAEILSDSEAVPGGLIM